MGMAASIFPLYTVEITEPKYKSTVGSVFGVAVGAGVVIAVSIQVTISRIWLAALWGLTTLLITYYSPDSPSMKKKRKNQFL